MNPIKNTLRITVCLVKAILSGFTQVIWTMVAIFIFRNYTEHLLEMYSPGMFDKLLAVVFTNWIGLTIALTIFYMFVNLKDTSPNNYEKKKWELIPKE